MTFKNGKIWPYAIFSAIVIFFVAIVVSVTFIVKNAPVERSQTNMMGYDHADLQANELIQAKIDFDKKYKISYITDTLSQEKTVLKYKITDLDDKPVNNASIMAIITRPNANANNQELVNPKVEEGVYTFTSVSLELPGRWNIMAKINVDNLQRFYNVKADTRAKEAFEY